MNRLSINLAGRVAEKIVFNDISSGAQNDLKDATSLAEKMVAQWGMSDKVGPVNLGRGEEHPFLQGSAFSRSVFQSPLIQQQRSTDDRL